MYVLLDLCDAPGVQTSRLCSTIYGKNSDIQTFLEALWLAYQERTKYAKCSLSEPYALVTYHKALHRDGGLDPSWRWQHRVKEVAMPRVHSLVVALAMLSVVAKEVQGQGLDYKGEWRVAGRML